MIRTIRVGIDIGTYMVRVVIAEFIKGDPLPHILGTGSALTRGLRRGHIIDKVEAKKSLIKAVREAEKASGITIKRAFLSIGGVGVTTEIQFGHAIISKADQEVTELDVKKAIHESEKGLDLLNRRILHTIPSVFKLDAKELLGRPEGLRGVKLEVKTLFVLAESQLVDDAINLVSDAGVDVVTVIASPFAEAALSLNDRQKNAGVGMINIGAETTTLSVFENGGLLGIHVFPIGSSDITNDIALGFQISLEEAEEVKVGSFIGNHSRKKLDEVIEARLIDIFELIDRYLKKMKRSGLLPAGVMLSGGGSLAHQSVNIAKLALKVPAHIAHSDFFATSKNKVKDQIWFVGYGLILASTQYEDNYEESSAVSEFFGSIGKWFKSMFNQLLP